MGYLSTTENITCKDSYTGTGDLAGYHTQQASVDITIDSNGKVSYTINMTNNGAANIGKGVYLYLKIGGTTLYNKYYSYGDNTIDGRWGNFPTGNNSGVSSSFTLSDTSKATVEVTLGICCMQSDLSKGNTVTLTIIRNTEGSPPTLKITDNGDNTFTLSGRTGINGANNNTVAASWLYYTTNGKDPAAGTTYTTQINISGSSTSYNKRICIPENCTVIYSTIISNFTVKGNVWNEGGHLHKDVKYYKQPRSKPGKPSITPASYKNNRLTIKQPWTYEWDEATEGNDNSPIKGYRIRIRKNGTLLKGLFVDSIKDSVVTIKKGTDTDEYVDTESSLTNISFDPVNLGFKAGDTVQLGIYAYSRNGNGITEWVADPTYPDSAASIKHSLWSGGGTTAAEVLSDTKTVQNAGVVQIKVGSEWKEGQVWVKANNTWYEADTVNIKANGEWHESE